MRTIVNAILMLVLLSAAGLADASTRTLFAGKNQPIGEVETFFIGNQLVVTAQVTEVGWCLGALVHRICMWAMKRPQAPHRGSSPIITIWVAA